jgi:tripeptide aminopeptidase
MTKGSINAERLKQTFLELVQIDSLSKEEGEIAQVLKRKLSDLGARAEVDRAGESVGGQTGNIIAFFPGNRPATPLLLAAHMDTVGPGRGIQPEFKDGVFSSSGETILGADDKSALAIILEVLQCIREQALACPPVEIVFTICEEIGLLGAKYLAYERLSAQMGYALDTRNIDSIITKAPCANQLTFKIYGKAAHAGSCPEEGINAISLAGKAIATLELGRIDAETTCNIGLIEGGLATNIVPDQVVVKGEVRSHNPVKLKTVTDTMVSAFEKTVGAFKDDKQNNLPKLESVIDLEFDRLDLDDAHPVVKLARQAAANLGKFLEPAASGGGSDANVFITKGIPTAVLGTGMDQVHTLNECIKLDNMVQTGCLVLEILRLQAGE